MLAKKLYLSATDADGAYLTRGMIREQDAVDALVAFAGLSDDSERALLCLVSGHDGRIELRHAGEGLFRARIVGANRRERMLWGLLPAREPVVWSADDLEREEVVRVVRALFTLPRDAFCALVTREAAA